jgi:hypothetical protein
MRRLMQASRLALLLLCAAGPAAVARADVKIKSRQTTQGQTYENTTYIKGKRQRSEQMGGQMVTIQQCDLRRDLQLMPQAKAYTVTPYADANATAATPAGDVRQTGGTTQGGLVTSTVTTKDTGERKQMFGYTARHIITTVATESSPDACSPSNSRIETDSWYIDAAFQLDCERERGYSAYRPQQKSGCQDRYQTKQVGTAKRGYPLWEKTTMFGEDGRESFSMINEVVELSQATLDAALFDAPADYREVKDFSGASMMAASGTEGNYSGNAGAASSPDASGMSANVKSMANAQGAWDAGEVGAKKPGVVRLGLAAVKTGSVGEGLSAADLAAAAGNTLAEHLKSPNVELIQLEAQLPSQVEAEARQKECDFVVYASVSHKKGGGGGGFGGMFGKVIAPAVGQVGIGHTGSAAGNVAGAVATNAIVSAGTISANVKQKDELTLDISVQAPGSATTAAARQFKSKAKSAGEDIITPIIEQAAQMILDAAKP